MTLREQKKQHIVAAVYATMKRMPGAPIEDILRVASMSPAPMYYITLDRAVRNLSLILRGRTATRNALKQALYEELAEKFKRAKCVTLKDVAQILETPASSFFITFETFRCAFYRTLRKKKLI
ncbi:MAG: hypothetical protein J6V47_05650 [Bacteroidaceae bacterium]|nr:hypothetical protein [Bacteroidaceae bacterium]